MKRVAVIFEGNLNERMGVFNAAINRVKHLQQIANFHIDVFMIHFYDGRLSRLMRASANIAQRPASVTVDGISIKLIWFKRSIIDAAMHRLFNYPPLFYKTFCMRLAKRLSGYQMVVAHDMLPAIAAHAMQQHYSIPMYIIWHGTSINTTPFRDKMTMRVTKQLLQYATCNITVSQAMGNVISQISPSCKHTAIPNGASSKFRQYSNDERTRVRQRLGLRPSDKVVAFAGRLNVDKNGNLLPELFCAIQDKCPQQLTFWTIGNGPLCESTAQALGQTHLKVKMWGTQDASRMPDFYNCIDLLVLPSRMEGMPLVAIEAMRCGACVVASQVGGTPEVVGTENCFPLDEHFISNLAIRGVKLINHPEAQRLAHDFTWEETAQQELQLYLATQK